MNTIVSLASPTKASAVPPDTYITQKSFVSNLVAILSGQLACAVIALAVQVCYARLLGPAGRGQISLALMIIAFCGLLGGVGGELPLVTWTAAGQGKTFDWLASVMWTGIVGSVFVVGLAALIYWKFDPAFLKGTPPALVVIALFCVPINIFTSYFMAILTGFERFQLRSVLALANQILGLLGVFLLAWGFGKTPEMALLGGQLGLFLSAVAAALVLRGTLRNSLNLRLAGRKFVAAFSLGARGMFGNLATFFNYRLDVFVVNYFLDTTQVGFYAVGVLVTEALWQIPQAAALALFPRTARTLEDGAAQFTCVVLRQVLAVACLTGVLMALFSPLVVPLVFGARFAPSVAVIWWLLPGVIALSLAKVISADLAARGKPEFSMIFAFVTLIATVLLDLFLIPRIGIRGAALASSLAYSLHSGLLLITLKYQFKISWTQLLVPSEGEFAVYRVAWLRLKSRFLHALASTGAGDAG